MKTFTKIINILFLIAGAIVNTSLLIDVQLFHKEPTLGRVYVALFMLVLIVSDSLRNKED